MNSCVEKILAQLERNFPEGEKLCVSERRINIRIAVKGIKNFAKRMRGIGAHLSTITCVDEIDTFSLIYHFDIEGCLINVYTKVDKSTPLVDSIVEIYPVADFYEREVYEMFGVIFRGHPRLEKFLLPDDWPKNVFPLRKR